MPGTLYLVATPIGNLEDLSDRARKTLASVDFVICEDTRRSRVLLEHAAVRKDLVSLPAFAEAERCAGMVERMVNGQSAAFVTDAGTPVISDPGEYLVAKAIESGVKVSPIPGPSALTAALAASGIPGTRFHFVGFLPRKAVDKRQMLEEVSSLSAALVIYESPQRLGQTLLDLTGALGDRRACVAREISKVHEEFIRGSLSSILERIEGREVKGEIVVVVEGSSGRPRWTREQVEAAVQDALADGRGLRDLSREIAKDAKWPAKEVYRLGLQAKGESR